MIVITIKFSKQKYVHFLVFLRFFAKINSPGNTVSIPIQTRIECPIRFTFAGINPETIVETPIISIKNVAIVLILVFSRCCEIYSTPIKNVIPLIIKSKFIQK